MKDQYRILVEMIKYEGLRLWQVFHLYLLVHILLLGLIISLRNESNSYFSIILGIAGILLCIPWAGAYFRHSQWYLFRIQRAKEVEEKLNWKIFRCELKCELFESVFRSMNVTPLVIIGFSIIYILLTQKINNHVIYLIVVPMIIFYAHISLLMKWKEDEKGDKNG